MRPCIIERSARWQVQVKAPSVNIVKVLHQDLAHCFCCALLLLQGSPTAVPVAVPTAVAAVAAPAAGVSCCGFRCYPPAKVSSCLLPSKLLLLPLLLFATGHVAAAVDAYAGGVAHSCCLLLQSPLLLACAAAAPAAANTDNAVGKPASVPVAVGTCADADDAAPGTASVVAGTPICG